MKLKQLLESFSRLSTKILGSSLFIVCISHNKKRQNYPFKFSWLLNALSEQISSPFLWKIIAFFLSQKCFVGFSIKKIMNETW